LINESLASLKATHSELQESFMLNQQIQWPWVNYSFGKPPKPILRQLLTLKPLQV
jgi:hypothetical protein